MQHNQPQALQLTLLGPFNLAAVSGQEIDVRGDKVRALLIYLAVEEAEQRRDALMAMFWPDLDQESAQTNLRQTLYRLRKALPNRVAPIQSSQQLAVSPIIADRNSVQLNPAADLQTDLVMFRQLIKGTQKHRHRALSNCPECLHNLEKAVQLYQSDFLLDFYLSGSNQFDDWARLIRVALRQDALEAMQTLSQANLDSGAMEKAERWARRQLELEPLRESAHRQLMQILAQTDRKPQALSQFDICRQILADELGTAPSAETISLYERIKTGDLDSSIHPGIRIREYVILDELGNGAFGSIYRAHQPSVDREVAIKVILPRYANEPEFRQRFESEARLVARLEHPHIVPLYDYWRDASGAHIVMRWLRQGSLQQRIEQGPMALVDVRRLLDQITSALAATHRQGIVHRDLKPANILLDELGNAYLSDFGIAKDMEVDARLTLPGTLMGSPAYMAPEQLRGEAVSVQSDIYSLGIILFELLSGKLPFEARNVATLIQQQLNTPLPSLHEVRPDLPPEIDRILAKATAKNPAERYENIRALASSIGQVLTSVEDISLSTQPPTLSREMEPVPTGYSESQTHLEEKEPFVGRQRQLEKLKSFLNSALSGEGQIVCITGGAGRGKTTLINEFAKRAMQQNPALIVAVGACNVFSAAGDPYLPFRQTMDMLTADVEAQRRAGNVTPQHARRLQEALPVIAEAIINHGSELLDILVPSKDLLSGITSLTGDQSTLTSQFRQLTVSESYSDSPREQKRLFSQFTATLHAICRVYPLILVLDDLQWIDKASASLLYHLSRHLAGQRLLIVCAYRREEVALGRSGERHPMEKVLSEVKSVFGSIWLNLADLPPEEEREFVNSLLDQEPNKLPTTFRKALFDHTSGHALFTVELLRALQERGDLVQDDEGNWIVSPSLDWDTLPSRIEGVIEERIGRLSPELRSLLNIASVDGQIFTAEVAARIEGTKIRRILHLLSRELEGIHHLVKEQEEFRINQNYLTRYQFGHALIQQYLYNQLGSGERRLLHAQIAETLQELVQEHWQPFAAELAWHWKQAGRPDQAVDKWLFLGDQARTAYAHAEAENFYKQAVRELLDQSELETAARTLMKLGLVYTADFKSALAQEAYDQAFVLWQSLPRSSTIHSPDQPGAELRLATEYPVSFDPGLIDNDVSTFLVSQLFEGLVRVGQDQNVLPAVAQRWEILDGGTRYIFHIREDIVWTDGWPLTASDFVFAWTRNLHPDTNSPSAHLLYVLSNARDYADGKLANSDAVGVSALDERTLVVQLERPTAYLPYLMAHTVAFPLPQHAVREKGKSWAEPSQLVSNGPYQVKSFAAELLDLAINPYYHGHFHGNVHSVKCFFRDDHHAILQAYGRNQLDVVNLINADPDTIARAVSLFGREMISRPRWSTFYLCFRCDKPPFDDFRVRQALAYALDRERLAVEGFQGQRRVAMGGFVPPGMPGHSAGIALPFDPDRGRELLAQAGYAGGSGFPAVEWAASPGGERVISFIQRAWLQNLNLNLKPVDMNWETFMEKLNRDPAQLSILAWGADIPDPENMLRTTFHSDEGINLPHWQNDQFDRLTDEAERVTDHAQRMALYAQADRILVAEETAVLPLSYDLDRLLVKPWVRLPVTPALSMSFSFANVVRLDEKL